MATNFTGGKFQAQNASGVLPGALLYSYAAGTLTPLATYTDQGGLSPNTNPVACDSNGQASVWLGGSAYRMILKTSAGVTVYDVDNITSSIGELTGSLVTQGSGLVNFDPTLNYAVNTIGFAARSQEWNAWWFSGVRAAVIAGTDCTASVQAAINLMVASGRGTMFFPKASYLFTGAAGSDTYANGILLPFTQVNPDSTAGIILRGESGTTFKCNANNMVLLRTARNNVTIKDITLSANSKTGVILWGIVPESMTQTTTLVSQQIITGHNVNLIGGASVDGIVIQPGPWVASSDSGCFYMNFYGIRSEFVGGGRHVYFKKNADWATHANRPTRICFYGAHLMRGNAGYHMEVASEVELHGCFEELINSDTTPLATPTARHISADCSNLTFFGGYSEACSLSVNAVAAGIIRSYGYIPASGSDATWIANVSAFGDATSEDRSWTPVLVSSGGGTQGAATSTGRVAKLGKIAYFTCQVSAAKGTLAAGTLTVTGLPYIADTGWAGAGLQGMPAVSWSNITFTANVFTMDAYISGSTLSMRKLHAAGAGPAGLTLAECADPVIFTVQGWYKTT